jgi:hypothetical protein
MFDPYSQWMSIPKGPRPPTHYQLLGITPDERNAEVIKEAALRQTAQVRVYQAGPQGELCTRLLNAIAQARAVLLNPKLREEYDAHMVEPQAAPAAPIPVQDPLATAAFEDRSRPVADRRSHGFPVGSLLAALGYFLLVLAGAGVSFWLSCDRLQRATQVQPGPGKARVPAAGDKHR